MPQMKFLAATLALCAAASVHAADIKVGIALDISGPFSALGAEARDGFELAIEKLGGKLGGQPAEFLRTDFGGSPEQANQLVARYLQREKIDFFTGPIGSNAALAVGPALFAARVPYLSSNPGPSVYAGDKCNPYFFAQYQNDTYDEAAGKVANEKGYKNVVLIAPNYPAGKDHLNGFKRLYKGAVKDEIYTKLGQIDYAPEIAQIRAAKPDAVFFFLPGAMGINFVKQFVGGGLKDVPLIAPGFSADEDVIQAVGEPMLGVLNTAHWTHDLDVPANAEFVAAFRQKYDGRYPSVYAAMAYDTLMAMDAAVRDVGGSVGDREAVLKALKNPSFKSVRGDFTYGVNNYPVQNYYLREVGKDADGRLTNKLVGITLENHQDAYVGACRM
ncbi:ABC transporter substrate-binding protein [Thauera sp. Sel9]|uniref:ABC transporter substrate-binding protein n=1 Tax=Thauera sp. Sel9 TaxID=2974299 RepID=UPI0021E112AD|nr:ABC transporter substrate-binding protein [Thauera sp. Sel9]MCV2218203.1 ABC transporter substrate-binding protein [Thauera sp. Sel9]